MIISLALTIVAIARVVAALLYGASAAVQPVNPDVIDKLPRLERKTPPAVVPCLAGEEQIIGIWVIRDQDGNVVAIGALRKRC